MSFGDIITVPVVSILTLTSCANLAIGIFMGTHDSSTVRDLTI